MRRNQDERDMIILGSWHDGKIPLIRIIFWNKYIIIVMGNKSTHHHRQPNQKPQQITRPMENPVMDIPRICPKCGSVLPASTTPN